MPSSQSSGLSSPIIIGLERQRFQKKHADKHIDLYTLENDQGMMIRLTNYGAKVMQIIMPDISGVLADVALGYDSIDAIQCGHASMGAFIGRYANRIGNAKFSLSGTEYQLTANSGVNCLHGGSEGSRFQVFDARQLSPSAIELNHTFHDGEDGFPGRVSLKIVYSLTKNNEFCIEWEASVQQKPTVANFTSHIFFNLTGNPEISICDHLVTVNADRYLPVDSTLVPTGELASVTGTPMDFRSPKTFKQDIDANFEQLKFGNGYDHHYVLSTPRNAGELHFSARALDPKSGRCLEVWTTEPGMQLFSGNILTATHPIDIGKGNTPFAFRGAFCMEPSHFPDSPNNPHFPNTTRTPGEIYTGKIVYKFSCNSPILSTKAPAYK